MKKILVALAFGVVVTLPVARAGQPTEARSKAVEAVTWYAGTGGRMDMKKARKLFLEAAEAGDVVAKMWVARCYFRGRCGFPKDASTGQAGAREVFRSIEDLANKENRQAMFLLGAAYLEGLATEQDHGKALAWLRKAADKGDAIALDNIGFMYAQGLGVPKDYEQAVKWTRKAVEAGSANAMTTMAIFYETGIGLPRSTEKAAAWYRKAADAGHIRGMLKLAGCYRIGVGVEKNAAHVAIYVPTKLVKEVAGLVMMQLSGPMDGPAEPAKVPGGDDF